MWERMRTVEMFFVDGSGVFSARGKMDVQEALKVGFDGGFCAVSAFGIKLHEDF